MHEVRLPDPVAGFFLEDDPLQLSRQLNVVGFTPECGLQVVLAETEKAGANFTVGGQADPVAVAAKRLADRRDDPDFASPLPKPCGL